MDLSSERGLEDQINTTLNEKPQLVEMLPEAEIRQMSRGMNVLIPKDITYLDETHMMHVSLARAGRIASHSRGTPLDAFTSFLEHILASCVTGLRKKFLSVRTLYRAFDVYVERSGDAHAKPTRHLLKVLVGLIVQTAADEATTLLIQHIVYSSLCLIYAFEDSCHAKAAMNILNALLQKNIIYASSILMTKPNSSSKNIIGHAESLTDCMVDSLNASRSRESIEDRIHNFVSRLMEWLQHADTAPVAGRLLVTVFESFHRTTESRNLLASLSSPPRVAGWVAPVVHAMHQHPGLVENIEIHLLPSLLRLDASESDEFLHAVSIDRVVNGNLDGLPEEKLRMCLIAVSVIEEVGTSAILYELSGNARVQGLTITQSISLHLLIHASASVRVAALKFLTYAPSSIGPFPVQILRTLQQTLPQFHAETDARARNEFCNSMRGFFSHVEVIVRRQSRSQGSFQEDQHQVGSSSHPLITSGFGDMMGHSFFLGWYVDFLVQELQPTASYPRHISSLKILKLLADYGLCSTRGFVLAMSRITRSKDLLFFEFYSVQVMRVLLDLCMDPFDDVRSLAATLLNMLPNSMLAAPTEPLLTKAETITSSNINQHLGDPVLSFFLKRAEYLMRRTGRADYADGLGRLYDLSYSRCGENVSTRDAATIRASILEHLLGSLEDDVRIAQHDLQAAVSSAPVHGRFITLRYIISRTDFAKLSDLDTQQWRRMHNRLVTCCSRIWIAVKGVLCYDSPEGHVIADSEDEEIDDCVKDTLSFCWRALKEASALINAMILNPNYCRMGAKNALDYEDLRSLGNLTLTQLAELRHRGAFSTVSQTFAACCTRCAMSENPMISGLPTIWYQETLSCIEAKASALTRRSAGLPAMITGVLSAYASGRVFDSAVSDLQAIASLKVAIAADVAEPRFPQVHALNCLKDIFTNSRFGPATESHLAKTLTIAVDCLGNNIWAIRNCGLMLLKALLTRLMGGTGISSTRQHQSRRTGSKLTYAKYPVLAHLVLRLLQGSSTPSTGFGDKDGYKPVGASSQRMSTVFPAMEIIERVGVSAFHKDLIMRLLTAQLGSPVWGLREKAAKILGGIHDRQVVLDDISSLLQGDEPIQNTLHGNLLCLKVIVCDKPQRYSDRDDYETFLQSLVGLFDGLVLLNSCPITAATYLDILNQVIANAMIRNKENDSMFAEGQPMSEHMTYSVMSQHIVTLNEKFASKWAVIVDGGLPRTNLLSGPITDSLISALSRGRVLLGILQAATTGREQAVLDVLRCLGKAGDIAVSAAIHCFNDLGGAFRLSAHNAIVLYIDLLKRTDSATYRIPLMEGLATFLDSYNTLLRSREITCTVEAITIKENLTQIMDLRNVKTPASPELAHAALELRGALLALACILGPFDCPKDRRKLEIWTGMLRLACTQRSDLPTRLAAVSSLGYFKAALRPCHSKASFRPEFLRVYLAVYDTLLDDDEDVREKAAAVTSWILSNPTSPHDLAGTRNITLSAVAAAEKLLEILQTLCKDSKPLFWETLRRMTGTSIDDPNDRIADDGNPMESRSLGWLTPVKDLLASAMKEDTSLFVEEKQNLYIDPVQESKRWASVLHAMSIDSIYEPAAASLQEWVVKGLECLTEVAAKEGGGSGWTSKPDVFTLGMQVLRATSVILVWHRKGLLAPEPSVSDLLRSFKLAEMHPIWLRNVPEE
ncbi:hypothetical protein MMC13_006843 [Lambiella insularis]|nr:hypothetical protein [Lambiella insularis]